MQKPITPEDRYNYAVDWVLAHEGGLSNHPKDPGGPTNYGLSLRFLRAAGIDIDNDGDVDLQDILRLDYERAKEVYKRFWWDKYRYEAINNINVARKIFDLAVNMGAHQAHKIAQISANRMQTKPIAVDGVFGPRTIGTINGLTITENLADEFYRELQDNQAHFYINLAANRPELKAFLKGWLNRAKQ